MYPSDQNAEIISKLTSLGIAGVPTKYMRVGVDQLHRGPWQFRRDFSEESIAEMASSLTASSINVNPLIIAPRKAGGWFIICGERRWRGAQAAKIHELQCIAGDYTEEQALFIAIVDNIQRREFNPIEEGMAFKRLLDNGQTHDEIAADVGRSRGHVSNYIRLLSLDLQVKDHIIRGALPPSHARLLCALDSLSKQRDLATMAVRSKWSYKTLQAKVNEVLMKPRRVESIAKGDPDVDRLARIISEETGYPCIIKKTESGAWQAGFLMHSNEQFAGLLERMGIDVEI